MDAPATARTTDSTRKTRRCPMLQASAPPVRGPRPQAMAEAELSMPKAAPRCFFGSMSPTMELREVIMAPLHRPERPKSRTKTKYRWLKNWGSRASEAPMQDTISMVRRFSFEPILPTNIALTPEQKPITPKARPVSKTVRLASVMDWMKPGATGARTVGAPWMTGTKRRAGRRPWVARTWRVSEKRARGEPRLPEGFWKDSFTKKRIMSPAANTKQEDMK